MIKENYHNFRTCRQCKASLIISSYNFTLYDKNLCRECYNENQRRYYHNGNTRELGIQQTKELRLSKLLSFLRENSGTPLDKETIYNFVGCTFRTLNNDLTHLKNSGLLEVKKQSRYKYIYTVRGE